MSDISKIKVSGVEYDIKDIQARGDLGNLGTRVTELEQHGGGGGGVQPDWNQNDSTAADYVKNRPFYTGNPVENVLVEETTVSFADKGSIYLAQFTSTFMPTVGETYKVYWDGTAYECVCTDIDGMLFLGNLSLRNVGPDTGEPFLAIYNSKGCTIGTIDTSPSHAISISRLASEISKIDKKYLPFPFKPDGISYLTFSSRNRFSLGIEGNEKKWDGTLEYFASDETWTVWDGTSSLSAVANGGEYVLYLRGTGNTVISYDSGWNLEGFDISCIGNIETLLDYATVESGGHPVMADYCYNNMFLNCTSLIQAPELPATTLADSCYYGMFHGCTSLIQAPELPATTLADSCYYSMFVGCTSLIQAPELPATTLANSCYSGMFEGCTSLIQAPKLPATTLADSCYSGMFIDCTSLIQAPKLPATTLANSCYSGMFEGCTSLKLSTTRTGEYTQEYRIPFSAVGTDANSALGEMFTSTGGTFTGTPEINTTYYLSSDNMIARGNDIANLNGYVKSMIDNAECIITSSTSGSTKKFKITVDDSGTISATAI